MVALSEGDGNVAADDGAERATFREHAHVDVDQKKSNGEERGRRVKQDREIAQEAQVPGNGFREPQDNTSDEQGDGSPEKSPEKEFLAGIVAPGGWHLFILICGVVLDGFPPLLVNVSKAHLLRPHHVHVPRRAEEDQSGPRMQHPGNRRPAENHGHPEEPRGPERQARQQEINVGDRGDPVRQALT